MATKQSKQNSDLTAITNLINDRFNQLDRKLDNTQAELKREITETKAELKRDIIETKAELKQDISDVKGDVKALHVEVRGLEKRLSNVEASATKIPEITEKFGELKKRCDPADVSSAKDRAPRQRQTAFVIIAGVVSAFLGWIARAGMV